MFEKGVVREPRYHYIQTFHVLLHIHSCVATAALAPASTLADDGTDDQDDDDNNDDDKGGGGGGGGDDVS